MKKCCIRDLHSESEVQPRFMDYVIRDDGVEYFVKKEGHRTTSVRVSDVYKQMQELRESQRGLEDDTKSSQERHQED